MKKSILAVALVVSALTSCTTVKQTATSVDVANELNSVSMTDLEISNTKIIYSFRPEAKERRGGTKNVVNAAIRAALNANNAEVLVAPETDIRIRRGLFGTRRIKEVVVYGYPAKYKNFRVVK